MRPVRFPKLTRRRFLDSAWRCSLVTALSGLSPRSARTHSEEFPPIRTITRGPSFHWFGYYDKLQFNPSNRFVLSNQVDFEHRTPRADDVIKIGMVDTGDSDRWIELGQSRAWGWQQGCMLQWRAQSENEVVWNDREGDRFVCRVLNTETREQRTIDTPIYTLSHDGRFALSADFARIQVMRPGYGYVGLPDRYGDELAPRDSGVFLVDMTSGEKQLILSLADAALLLHNGTRLKNVWHYFNHLLISPDSKRFIVLHRWRARDETTGAPKGGFTTRMITADVDGNDVYILDPSGHTSHFIWRDPEHVCMWTRPAGKKAAFYLFRDRTRQIEIVGDGIMTRNGHNTYLPIEGNGWILCDTYPNTKRLQEPYLFNISTGKQYPLGAFHLPKTYAGQWRCDTHPRSSNDGHLGCIDSPHAGNGRQLHLIDVSQIVG